MENGIQISDATHVSDSSRRQSAGPLRIEHADTKENLGGGIRRRRSVGHLRLEHLDSSPRHSPCSRSSVDASGLCKSTVPKLSNKDRQKSSQRLYVSDSGVTKEDQRSTSARLSAQDFASNESASPRIEGPSSACSKIKRPSSACSARAFGGSKTLPASARPFHRSSTSGPNSGPRRMSSSGGLSPSPVRRRRSVCAIGGRTVESDAASSPSSRRRRSDVDMIGKNRPSQADQSLEDCVFTMPQTLMDHWTRRSIFQKARGLYVVGKSSQACETLKDKLHLAAKATHQGVRNTLLERHVVECWQDTVKDRLSAKDAENSETLATNVPDVPAAPDVLLDDFKSLSSQLEELKKMKADQLPESIQAALKKIDVKLDKFDILNDLMHMHLDSYGELSDKFASQIDGMAKMISNLSWAFSSLYKSVEEEIAGSPQAADAGLRKFLPAVEHCLVALGIITKDLGVPKTVDDYDEPETPHLDNLDNGASRVSNINSGRTTSVRRFSRHGSMGLSDSTHATSLMLENSHLTEAEVVSEHVAPEIIACNVGDEAEDDDDDLCSLGGLTDSSDTNVGGSAAEFVEISGASVKESADSSLQAEPASQADPALQTDPESIIRGSSPTSETADEFQPVETDTLQSEWPQERSKTKQSTWHGGKKVQAFQWQAVCKDMEQSEQSEQMRTPRLGSMFGRTISPCMKKVENWTDEASKVVCEANEAVSSTEVFGSSDSAAGGVQSTAVEIDDPTKDDMESDAADASRHLTEADSATPTFPVASTVSPAPSKRESPIRDRAQMAKPSQPKPKYHRSAAKYSTDNLSVVQKKLLASIVEQDGKTPQLLQIVCEASAAEYLPQASRCSPQYDGILPWEDNTVANCRSRPETSGKMEGEQGVISAPLPTISDSTKTTPGLFGSLPRRNQLMKKSRPTPGSHKSLIRRRSEMPDYSLPVLVGRF